MKTSRNTLIARTMTYIDYISSPAWRSTMDLAAKLNISRRTANRWINAASQAGIALEFSSDATRFRRVR